MKSIIFHKKQIRTLLLAFTLASLLLLYPTNNIMHRAEASVLGILLSKATISMPNVLQATSYNVYFKEVSSKTFNHASRNISITDKKHKIYFLKKNVQYKYKISAVDASGKEFWWSPVRLMINIQRM